MSWSDGIAEGVKDLKDAIAIIAIIAVFFGYVIPVLQNAFSQLSPDTSPLGHVISMMCLSLALLSVVEPIGLSAVLIEAINDWEYGIARALMVIIGLPIVVLLAAVISPSMISEVAGLALLASILLMGAILGVVLWVLKSLDMLS